MNQKCNNIEELVQLTKKYGIENKSEFEFVKNKQFGEFGFRCKNTFALFYIDNDVINEIKTNNDELLFDAVFNSNFLHMLNIICSTEETFMYNHPKQLDKRQIKDLNKIYKLVAKKNTT